MKTLILLLSLIGLGCALQPGLFYKYRYHGRLGTGIPNVRSQVVGTGINFDVWVLMKEKSQAIVMFHDVKVGEYHGDVSCDLRTPMPISFKPLPSQFADLTKPFSVNFLETREKVMEVMKDEEEWITNIRKSVVTHLRSAPLRANMGKHEGDTSLELILANKEGTAPITFVTEEDTILGRCPSEYTIIKLPDFMSEAEDNRIRKEITKDVEKEGKKSSSRSPLRDQLWRVVRDIDFHRCQDTVMLMHAGMGNATQIGRGHLKYIQSRSSTTKYIIRGSPGNFRFERGVSEGSYIVDTYGFKSEGEEIKTVTNQTMHLISVEEADSAPEKGQMVLPPNVTPVRTWKYGVISPYGQPSNPAGQSWDWVTYLNKGEEMPLDVVSVVTGVKMTPERMNQYKAHLQKIFDAAITELKKDPVASENKPYTAFDTSSGKAAFYLNQAATLVQGLKTPQLKELFNMYKSKGELEKMLFIDMIAASGTRSAIQTLLSFHDDISSVRAATVFMTYTNNILEPEAFNDVMTFLKKMDIKSFPFYGAAAFINFAQTAQRACVSEYRKNYTIPLPVLGNAICTRRQVIDELLPFLKERIDAATTSWERAIYAQAIGNLGTPEVIEVLRPYIYGHKDLNPRVRTTALYSLASWKLPPTSRSEVFEILMPIIDNVGESVEVRERAVKLLISWGPDSSWWQRMAAMTWHEPNRQMASFISSIIYTTSRLNHIAHGPQLSIVKRALHLAKPTIPSLRNSYFMRSSRFDKPSELMTSTEISWMTNQESVIPKDVDTYFYMRLGGFNYKLFDIVLQSDGLQNPFNKFMDMIRGYVDPTSTEHSLHNSDAANAHDIYQKFIDAVKMENYNRHAPEAMLYMKFFDNMQQYLPLNADVLSKFGSINSYISMLSGTNLNGNVAKFFDPTRMTVAIASEVGLPILTHIATPTIMMAEGSAQMKVTGGPEKTFIDKKIEADVEIKMKAVSKVMVYMKTIAPWSEKSIASGIDAEKQINIPVKAKIEISKEDNIRYLRVTAQQTVASKYPLIHFHNIPFTAKTGMWPTYDISQDLELKPIHVNMPEEKPLHSVTRKFGRNIAGISGEMTWQSDIADPFTSANLFEMSSYPERFLTMIGGVDAKHYKWSVNIDPSDSPSKQATLSLTFVPTHRKIEGTSNEGITVDDTIEMRYKKVKGLMKVEDTTNKMGLARAELELSGSEKRVFDMSLGWYRTTETSTESTMIHGLVAASPIPNISTKPQTVCGLVSADSTSISFYQDFLSILNANPKVHVTGKFEAGETCQGGKAAEVKLDVKLSERRKDQLAREYKVASCSNKKDENMVNSFPIDAVYDEATAHISYDKGMPKYILNATYIVGDTIRGIIYPNIYFDSLDINNPEGKIELVADRPLESHYWRIWTEMPHKRAIVSRLYLPYIIDSILPIGGVLSPVKRFNQIALRLPSDMDKCVIEPKKVRTFDGLEYKMKEDIPCWTVAAKDRVMTGLSWVLETRTEGGKVVARITSKARSSVIEIKEGEIKINGEVHAPKGEEVVMDVTGHPFARIVNIDGKYAVEMPDRPYKIAVMIKNGKAEIYASQRYKGMMSGLCGDYTGDKMYDLQGPKHCLYYDPNMFMHSWVSEETDCPAFAEYQGKVKAFQAKCHKAPTHNYKPYITSEYMKSSEGCKRHPYFIKEEQNRLCVMTTPTCKCGPSCKEITKEHSMVTYKCWPKDVAPAEIKSNYPSPGYVEKPVSENAERILHLPAHYSQKCGAN